MKKLSLGIAVAAALGFVAGPVSAADLPIKAPPPMVMPALYNWNGLYIGVEGGGVMGQNSDWFFVCTDISCSENFGHPLHGGFVGGEAGFNWQAGQWVFGIEGDGNWSELEEALACGTNDIVCGSKIRHFETVRGRIGYAFGPTGNFLVYVTGGWATASQGEFISSLVPPFPSSTHWARTDGFVVGGGAEYGILPYLSLKAEVLYINLDRKDYPDTILLFPTGNGTLRRGFAPTSVESDFVVARMALNWRFNWGKGKGPAPVVARY